MAGEGWVLQQMQKQGLVVKLECLVAATLEEVEEHCRTRSVVPHKYSSRCHLENGVRTDLSKEERERTRLAGLVNLAANFLGSSSSIGSEEALTATATHPHPVAGSLFSGGGDGLTTAGAQTRAVSMSRQPHGFKLAKKTTKTKKKKRRGA